MQTTCEQHYILQPQLYFTCYCHLNYLPSMTVFVKCSSAVHFIRSQNAHMVPNTFRASSGRMSRILEAQFTNKSDQLGFGPKHHAINYTHLTTSKGATHFRASVSEMLP